MDFFGTTLVIDKNYMCKDKRIERILKKDMIFQAFIRALKEVYENEDGDNKGQEYGS